MLKEYVTCIKTFYPESKINILAHSMGGLIARRYILENSDTHGVGKLVTIGTPWLGAPKAIYTLETGRFFDNPFYSEFFKRRLDNALHDTLKDLVEFFPGTHELLPSRWYFNLGGLPFSEVRGRTNAPYTFDQLGFWVNRQHTESSPATNGIIFHDYRGQDDWRGDSTGVQYYHIYGEQKREKTIGQVVVTPTTLCLPFTNRCTTLRNEFDLIRTSGDGTVPLLSARRYGNGISLNAHYNDPNDPRRMHYFISLPPHEDSDHLADHTGMTQDPAAHELVLALLRPAQEEEPPPVGEEIAQGPVSAAAAAPQASGRRGAGEIESYEMAEPMPTPSPAGSTIEPDVEGERQTQSDPSYYLTFTNTGQVTVTDASGNSNTPIDDVFVQGVPGVDIDPLSKDSVQVVTSTAKEYTITFRGSGEPMAVKIIKGENNTKPVEVIRYTDLGIPAGATAMLKTTPYGVENLRYDADLDGVFETDVQPTASVTGDAARDIEPPSVTFIEELRGAKRLVTIGAVDDGSGVKVVRYSLDGTYFQPYTEALLADPAQSPLIHAFADDNVANRSASVTYRPLVPSVTLSRDAVTREIVVTVAVRNDGTAPVVANLVLGSARLGNTSTTALPVSLYEVEAGETATVTLRFPASAAATGAIVKLSGGGTSHGKAFGGGIGVIVP